MLKILLVACVVQISIIGFDDLKGQQLYNSLTKINPKCSLSNLSDVTLFWIKFLGV